MSRTETSVVSKEVTLAAPELTAVSVILRCRSRDRPFSVDLSNGTRRLLTLNLPALLNEISH